MKKIHKIVLWSGGVVAIVAVTAYMGMNYAVDRVMNSLVASAIQAEADPSSLISGDNQSVPVQPETSPSASAKDATEKNPSEKTATASTDLEAGDKSATQSIPNQSGGSEEKQTTPASKTSDSTYKAEISTDKAKKVQEEITVKEKAMISSILLKKLGASDISAFLNMSKGGVSEEEKLEAKRVILQKLSEDEYNQLIAIAAKYGLSQGHSYKETAR
ncbi:hypothetical protein [Paenibacillus sp. MBLB4367]|uniref:hypothetical protein n=1 Tax=Paenibacillus sp. MBLB4367 TaxID=3384767 RepID=UPI0039080AD3